MTTHQQDANLRRYFDQQAARYGRDPLTRWLGRHEMAALAELAPPAPEPGVTPALDFGCGTGRASDVLLRCGYRVTGYDLSEAMVAQARRNLEAKPGLVLTTDRESVAGPWPLVAAMGVLDYHADTASLWREWRSLLSPDGVLVITAPDADRLLGRLYASWCRLTSCPTYAFPEIALTEEARNVGLAVTGWRRFAHTLVLRLTIAPSSPGALRAA